MSYIFPQGYSGPFHDYYTYDDFDGALPTSGAGGGVKALINGTNSNCFLDGYADLSGVFLKPRRFNNHGYSVELIKRTTGLNGGTANYSEIISWNSGNKSMFLLTPEHVVSTAHGCQFNGTDRGFGRADDGNAILQFMERNGATFNVTLTNGGLSGGASYLDIFKTDCSAIPGFSASASISDTPFGGDLIIFKLSEPIVGKDVKYYNEFYDGWRSGQGSSADIFCLKSQNTVLPLPAGSNVGSVNPIVDEFSLGVPPQVAFSCDSGSTTFVIHKEKGTLLTSRQADGVRLLETMIPKLNEYLSSEGYAPGVTLYKVDEISQNWYNYFDMRAGNLDNSETISVPSWANAKKMSVRVVATDRNGRKSKPVTKIINVDQSGNIPPNVSTEPVLSNLPISNSFYCSPGTDGAEIGNGFGSIYLGYTMDKHPDSDIFYGSFGVTNNCSVEIRAGNTFGNNELSTSISLLTKTRIDSNDISLVNFGGSAFTGFKGAAQGLIFGSEYAGLTIYARPTTSNVLGVTTGDWSELGKAITPGRGSTFTSFSFDNYGPTAGGTMIGTAAGYTAIPETGTNKIQDLFGLGGLTIGDIKINGASYVSGMTFSGPTFALKIPSDCPAGASLGIITNNGIQYINPYNLGAGVTFPGIVDGVTYINVGG